MYTKICMYCIYNLFLIIYFIKKKIIIIIYTYAYSYVYICCIHIIRGKNKWRVRERKNDVGTRTSIILGKRQKRKKIEWGIESLGKSYIISQKR